MKGTIGAIVAVLLVALLLGGCSAYQGYRKVIVMDEQVKSSWSQVENQLQRRYDLIDNLVNTVKGVTQQEQKVFGDIAEARTRYAGAKTTAERAEAATEMESALARLMVIVENYPELKSNESFLKLQDELAGTENRLAVERKRYNDSVQAINAYIRPFPGSFYAGLAGVGAAEYYKIDESARQRPKVDFSEKQAKQEA